MITRKNEAAGLPSARCQLRRQHDNVITTQHHQGAESLAASAGSEAHWAMRKLSLPLSLTSLIVAYSKRTGTLVSNAVPVDERVRKEFVCVVMLKEQTKSTYLSPKRPT